MAPDHTARNVVFGLIALIVVIVAAVFFVVQNTSLGYFSSQDACVMARSSLLSKNPAYTYCTPCGKQYGSAGGYSAGCFLSGSKGEQCLSAGGVCSDTSCSSCAGATQSCSETSAIALTGGSSSGPTFTEYQITNWGGVCGKTVYRVVCAPGLVLSGKEYSSLIDGVGYCLTVQNNSVSTGGTPACSPSYPAQCSTMDTCGGSRITEGASCGPVGSGTYCASGLCQLPCLSSPVTQCQGTTLLSNPHVGVSPAQSANVVNTVSCVYDQSFNSQACGYVPPVDSNVTGQNWNASNTAPVNATGVAPSGGTFNTWVAQNSVLIMISAGILVVLLGIGAFVYSEQKSKRRRHS